MGDDYITTLTATVRSGIATVSWNAIYDPSLDPPTSNNILEYIFKASIQSQNLMNNTQLLVTQGSATGGGTTPPPTGGSGVGSTGGQKTGTSPPSLPPSGTINTTGGGTTTPPNGTKWNPGHYLYTYKDAPQSDFDIILQEPNIKGVQVQYYWAELEPQEGVYDFSKIESDLAYLQAKGKRLIIRIEDRTFTRSSRQMPPPSYLRTNPKYNGGYSLSKTGYVANLWDPVVMDRLILLYQELGKRFNNEPYFEGITTEETAPGLPTPKPPGFSASKWATQLKRGMLALKQAFPNTVVFQSANYLGSEIPGIIDYTYQIGIGTQGPDLFLSKYGKSNSVAQQYRTANYIGKMPISDIVSHPLICGRLAYPSGGCTSPDLFYDQGVNVYKPYKSKW